MRVPLGQIKSPTRQSTGWGFIKVLSDGLRGQVRFNRLHLNFCGIEQRAERNGFAVILSRLVCEQRFQFGQLAHAMLVTCFRTSVFESGRFGFQDGLRPGQAGGQGIEAALAFFDKLDGSFARGQGSGAHAGVALSFGLSRTNRAADGVILAQQTCNIKTFAGKFLYQAMLELLRQCMGQGQLDKGLQVLADTFCGPGLAKGAALEQRSHRAFPFKWQALCPRTRVACYKGKAHDLSGNFSLFYFAHSAGCVQHRPSRGAGKVFLENLPDMFGVVQVQPRARLRCGVTVVWHVGLSSGVLTK